MGKGEMENCSTARAGTMLGKLNDFSTYSFPGQSWWLAHSQGQGGSGGLEWLRCEGTSREQGVTRLLPIPLPGFNNCSVPEARGWMRQTLYMCSWLGLGVPLLCAALCLMMDITGRVNSHSFVLWLRHCERFPYRSRQREYRGKMGVWEPRCWDVLLPSSAAKQTIWGPAGLSLGRGLAPDPMLGSRRCTGLGLTRWRQAGEGGVQAESQNDPGPVLIPTVFHQNWGSGNAVRCFAGTTRRWKAQAWMKAGLLVWVGF